MSLYRGYRGYITTRPNTSMKYIRELIITALIVGLLLLAWDSSLERKKLKAFADKEKALKYKLDSITVLQHRADLEATRALTSLNVAKQELSRQSHITERLTLKYNVLKNMAPANLSDSAINAKVARLYPHR